jgi:hypothetical protein
MPKIQLPKGMEHDYSIECEESKHTTLTKQQHDPLQNPYSFFCGWILQLQQRNIHHLSTQSFHYIDSTMAI